MSQRREKWDAQPYQLGWVMPEEVTAQEFVRAHARAEAAEDGVQRLEAIQKMLRHLPYLIERAVTRAREEGYTWEQIGDARGVSKQAAQQRFSDRNP